MELWATWSSGRCPCSWQRGWYQTIFKVPSNPYHSMILWFYIASPNDKMFKHFPLKQGSPEHFCMSLCSGSEHDFCRIRTATWNESLEKAEHYQDNLPKCSCTFH